MSIKIQNNSGPFGKLCIHGFLPYYAIAKQKHSAAILEWVLKCFNWSVLD